MPMEDNKGPLGLRLLYAPALALVDIIFVHGLNGGSVESWCVAGDRETFWPLEWLPQEPGFQYARIHTFGYATGLADAQTNDLDLDDLGRSLLNDLVTSPTLRGNQNTKLLLVGHSFGGLVIKQTFLLARSDRRFAELEQRIKCIFFFSTPHRGIDWTNIFNDMLHTTNESGDMRFLMNMEKCSLASDIANDEFRKCSGEIDLWSFYETMRTKIGATNRFVVDRYSALSYLMNEKDGQPLNANHKTMCKYNSFSDPSYIVVRNSLAQAVHNITSQIIGDGPSPLFLYPIALRDTDFRILRLLPGHSTTQIVCQTYTHRLDEPPHYVALSYVWGEEHPLHTIIMNGFTVAVRPSLYYALRNQRLQQSNAMIWVDYLCINQADLLERSRQVRRMAEIYHKAEQVCIWLGEADSSSDEGMASIEPLANMSISSLDMWWDRRQMIAINRLMHRPWFQRGWVIQEVAYARTATFHCGDQQVSLADFRSIASKIATALRTTYSMEHPNTTSFKKIKTSFEDSPASKLFKVIDTAIAATDQDHEACRNLSLEELVELTTYTSTSDPRDIIYTLLSMAKDVDSDQSATRESIVPDYEKTELEVFAEFITHCARSGSIDILVRPWAPVATDFEHPTWLRSRSFSAFGDESKKSSLQHHGKPLVGISCRYRIYNCHGNSKPRISTGICAGDGTFDGSLSIHGIVLGEIVRVSTRMASAVIPKDCLDILGLDLAATTTATAQHSDALWRTLCADGSRSGRADKSSFSQAFAQSLLLSTTSPAGSEEPQDFASIDVEELLASRLQPNVHEYLEVVRDTIWNRRTCRLEPCRPPVMAESADASSETGALVGLVPQHARRGDMLCVLYGCSVPVVLRKILPSSQERGGTGWHLVGDAYVDGMMDGEALERGLPHEDFRIL
ncbi:protein SERAC1 [Microdochium nivale]|nr:protein SERAC1 [Microdochium nivale]